MERLTYKGTPYMEEGEFVTPAYSNYSMRRVIAKLAEYEDLEEQGLLLRLPCKVGDTVFGLVNYCNACPKYNDYCHRGCTEPTYRLIDFKIDHFEIYNNGLRVSALSHYDGEGKWSETVFATREEAEAALQKMQEGE